MKPTIPAPDAYQELVQLGLGIGALPHADRAAMDPLVYMVQVAVPNDNFWNAWRDVCAYDSLIEAKEMMEILQDDEPESMFRVVRVYDNI